MLSILEKIFTKSKASSDQRADSVEELSACHNAEPLPVYFDLRILVIADTHGCLSSEQLSPTNTDVDVCLLLGDHSIQDIRLIQDSVTTAPIYGVLGNHDGFDLYDRCGIENIHGKVIELKGVRIAGLQGSLRYKDLDMPLYTDDESINIAENMQSADILISHDGPKFFHGNNDFAHSGLQGITHYCAKNNIPINIHGHHHENMNGVLENGTKSICCYGVQIINTRST